MPCIVSVSGLCCKLAWGNVLFYFSALLISSRYKTNVPFSQVESLCYGMNPGVDLWADPSKRQETGDKYNA